VVVFPEDTIKDRTVRDRYITEYLGARCMSSNVSSQFPLESTSRLAWDDPGIKTVLHLVHGSRCQIILIFCCMQSFAALVSTFHAETEQQVYVMGELIENFLHQDSYVHTDFTAKKFEN